MPRAIPCDVPDELAELIYAHFGDMKRFAEACGVPYTSVYSLLVRSSHNSLERLQRLARSIGVDCRKVVEVFLEPTTEARRERFHELCVVNGKAILEVCDNAGISHSGLARIIRGEITRDKFALYLKIIDAIGITLEDFYGFYKSRAA